MKKLVILNGSYRPKGFTTACLESYSKYLKAKGCVIMANYILDDDIRACHYCPHCNPSEWCAYRDQFQNIMTDICRADMVLIGSPVYNDLPTPKTMAFFSRLSFISERKNREFLKGKKAYLLAVGYCSGTKSTLHAMMGACEMSGFDMDGRSTREYVILWKDGKLRGGMNQEDQIFLPKETLERLNDDYLNSDYFRRKILLDIPSKNDIIATNNGLRTCNET